MTSDPIQYDRVQIILHWLIAVIILGMIGLGLFMVVLPKQSELPLGQESVRAFYFLLHKSLGMTAAVLIVMRIVWRLMHKPPPLPTSIPKWQQRAAEAVHGLFYFLLVAMPVSGFMQSMYSKYATKFWGIELPRLVEANKAAREEYSAFHEIFAFILIALIVIHILAALKHRISGTEITSRMSLRQK